MRIPAYFILLGVLLVSVEPAAAQSESGPPFNAQHPADAALYKDEDGNWTYVSFPAGSRLFTYSGDSAGESNCYQGCASAWPPLYVSDDRSSESVGHWTIIVRDDGREQWAYKGQPVYRRFHDLPSETEDSGFSPLKP